MVFQNFQREQEILDSVAKQTVGPNVTVKDPTTFKSFLQSSFDAFQDINLGSSKFNVPDINISEGVRDRSLASLGGLLQILSRGNLGEDFSIGGVQNDPGALLRPIADVDAAIDFGNQFGPTIPEQVPLVGGMTPAGATLGGLASLTSPADIALTLGTAGAGPAISTALRGAQIGARGLPGIRPALTRGAARLGEIVAAPVSRGPLPTRIAAETAIQAPFASTLVGTQRRQEEGISGPFDNVPTALGTSLLLTGGTVAGLSRTLAPKPVNQIKTSIAAVDNPDKSIITPEIDYSFQTDVTRRAIADFRDKNFVMPDVEPLDIKRKPFGVRYDENGNPIAVSGGSDNFNDDDLANFLQSNSNQLARSNDLGELFPDLLGDKEVRNKLKFLTRAQKKHLIDYIFGSSNPETGKISRGKIFPASDTNRVYTVANGYPNGKDFLTPSEQNYIVNKLINNQIGKKFDPALETELSKNPQLKDVLFEVFDKMPVILRRIKYGTKIPNSPEQDAVLDKLVNVVKTSNRQNNLVLTINERRIRDTKNQSFLELTNKNIAEGKDAFEASYSAAKTVRESFDEAQRKVHRETKKVGAGGYDVEDSIRDIKNSIIFNADKVQPIYQGKLTGTNGLITLSADQLNKKNLDIGKTVYQAMFDNKDVNVLRTLIDTKIGNQADREKAFVATVRLLGGTNYNIGAKPQNVKYGMQGKLPNASERNLLQKAFGKEVVKELTRFRGKGEKFYDAITQVWNVPRTLMATAEMSALFRQGGFYAFARPLSWAKSIPSAIKEARQAMFINKFDPITQRIELEKYIEDPDFEVARNVGLEISDSLSPSLIDREEQFIPTFLDNLPNFTVVGPIIRASAAFHSGFLNNLRFNVFKSMLKNMSPKGTAEGFIQEARKISPEAERNAYQTLQAMSRIINAATGRGPKLLKDEYVNVMNQVFFSWRMQTARAYLPIAPFIEYPQMNWAARKQITGDYVKFYGMVTTLGLLTPFALDKFTGDNTASYDWITGKLRVGKTTLDIASGNNKYVGVILNSLGKILDVDELKARSLGTKKPYDINVFDNVIRKTIKSSLHPTTGFILSLVNQEDFFGNELDYDAFNPTKTVFWGDTAMDYLTPLIYSGLLESIELYDSPLGPAAGFAGEFVGVGNSAYEDKQSISKELFGKRYTELLPFMQKLVTAAFYADHHVDRDVPNTTMADIEYFKRLNDIAVNMANGNLSSRDAVFQFREARNVFRITRTDRGNIEYGWDENDRDEGLNYYGGTPEQLQALSQHWSTFDQEIYLPSADGGSSDIVNWDEYDKLKETYNWSEDQARYVAANSNVMDYHIPDSIMLALKKHDPKLAEKIIDTWAARDYYMQEIEKDSPIKWQEELDFAIGNIIEKNKN